MTDFDALGREWRALELEGQTYGVPSFFRSWTWVGCLAGERFPDPVLLRAVARDRTVGLALLNRRGRRLHLGESGDPVLDAPFVEHNGPLVTCDGHAVSAALLRAAWDVPGARAIVLSGVEAALVTAAGGVAWRAQERIAPFVALDAVRRAGGDPLALLSANARAQIRRSNRSYESQGPLLLHAASADEAPAWLDALIALHAADWTSRGLAGAFATPFARRFHHALVARAAVRGELDLLRVRAGTSIVGFLYNLRGNGVAHAYQAGINRAGAEKHGKPGLTAHALAIRRAAAEGLATYDLMAGEQRYKASLAGASGRLAWVELIPRRSIRGWAACARGALRRATQSRR